MLILFILFGLIQSQTCQNDLSLVSSRKDCGYNGITSVICQSKGCCWGPLPAGTNGPWCFSSTSPSPNSCPVSLAGPNRIDCGFYGITQDQCLAKGCCWGPTTNGPWCFQKPSPLTTTSSTRSTTTTSSTTRPTTTTSSTTRSTTRTTSSTTRSSTTSSTTRSTTTTTTTTSAPTPSSNVIPGPANWPSKIFSPFNDISTFPNLDLSQLISLHSVKYFNLAFVISNANKDGGAWGGVNPLGYYSDQINAIRSKGGDVIGCFGGAGGTELGIVITDITKLTEAYKTYIDYYKLTFVDFDLEGSSLTNFDLRCQVWLRLQNYYPNLKISVTLPVTPTGLLSNSLNLISSIVRNGIRVSILNIMTMDYGQPNTNMMGEYAISAAKAAYNQIQQLGATSMKIGITPMIGKNDVDGEIFQLQDAQKLVYFAANTPWVSLMSFWSIARDNGRPGPLYASSNIPQSDYQFTGILRQFVTITGTICDYTKPASTRIAAGVYGITESQCITAGKCFGALPNGVAGPWCFQPNKG